MQYDRYRDRSAAGRTLAAALARHSPMDNPLVLALPRGGVPVAAEIARALNAELDVLVVRKLGHPLQPELALGAVAAGGTTVLVPHTADTVPPEELAAIAARERQEVERRARMYRGDRSGPDVRGRNVILVDDGVATGATMLAAIRAVRAAYARRVVVAVPVGDPAACVHMGQEADRVFCPLQPVELEAVGKWYVAFPQLSDDDVRAALEDLRGVQSASPAFPEP